MPSVWLLRNRAVAISNPFFFVVSSYFLFLFLIHTASAFTLVTMLTRYSSLIIQPHIHYANVLNSPNNPFIRLEDEFSSACSSMGQFQEWNKLSFSLKRKPPPGYKKTTTLAYVFWSCSFIKYFGWI